MGADVINIVDRMRKPALQWGGVVTIVPDGSDEKARADISEIWDPALVHDVTQRCVVYANALEALARALREAAEGLGS